MSEFSDTIVSFSNEEETLVTKLEETFKQMKQAHEDGQWYKNEVVDSEVYGRFTVTAEARNANTSLTEEEWDSTEQDEIELFDTFLLVVEYNDLRYSENLDGLDNIRRVFSEAVGRGDLYQRLKSGEQTEYNGWEVVDSDAALTLHGYEQQLELRREDDGYTIVLTDLQNGYEMSAMDAVWMWGDNSVRPEKFRSNHLISYITRQSPLTQTVKSIYENEVTKRFKDEDLIDVGAFKISLNPMGDEQIEHVIELLYDQAETADESDDTTPEEYRKKAELLEDFFADDPIKPKLEERRRFLQKEYPELEKSDLEVLSI